jgi:hypothetical protein
MHHDRCFKAALSSIASAKSFFSLPFSLLSPFQALGLRDFEPAVLGFPVVEARLADPVLPAQVGRFHLGLVLLHDGDDLLFGIALGLESLWCCLGLAR